MAEQQQQPQKDEKEWLQRVLKEHEVLLRTLKPIVISKSYIPEDIVHIWKVPLLSNGTTLREIGVGESGEVLFELGGEQIICKCKNTDTETIPIYTSCFVIEVPESSANFPLILRGASTQITINTYVTPTTQLQYVVQSLPGTLQPPLPGFANFVAAGTQTLITVPLQASGIIIHVSDLLVSGNVAGYGWLEYGGNIVWGRMNFPARSGWAQQLRGDWQITSDGVNSLLVRANLIAAGRGDASLLYSFE